MGKIKEKLQKNLSAICLACGVLNVMAGLHGFDGGTLDTISIGLGIVFLSFFVRGV